MAAKSGRLSVLGKQVDIGGVAGVKVEHVLPSGAHPLRGYGYEPVDERFHARPGLYAESFERVNAQQPLVEIAYDSRDEHEHRVLPHLLLGQVVPSEIVVHLGKYLRHSVFIFLLLRLYEPPPLLGEDFILLPRCPFTELTLVNNRELCVVIDSVVSCSTNFKL